MRVREREKETRCLTSTLPSFPSLITTTAPKSIVLVAAFAMEHKDDPAAAAAAATAALHARLRARHRRNSIRTRTRKKQRWARAVSIATRRRVRNVRDTLVITCTNSESHSESHGHRGSNRGGNRGTWTAAAAAAVQGPE